VVQRILQAEPEHEVQLSAHRLGGGIRQFSEGTIDFGATDAFIKDDQIAKAPDVVHIPTVLGAVVVAYNAPGLKTLRFSGETLANVFLGRSPSGTTRRSSLTTRGQDAGPGNRRRPPLGWVGDQCHLHRLPLEGLSRVQEQDRLWHQRELARRTLGGKGNDGVTALVKSTPGSIGTSSLPNAIQQKLSVAELKNKDGSWSNPPSRAPPPRGGDGDPGRFPGIDHQSLGQGRLPIAGFTWLLVHKDTKDAAKGKAIVGFLRWALTEGEKMAPPLDYAPLPQAVAERVLKTIDTLTVNGAKISAK
jgi:phosphate transport system substrate-binding protein